VRNASTLVDIIHGLQSQFVPALLFRQPFRNRLSNNPALATVNPIRNFIQARDKVIRQLCRNYSSIISHDRPQSQKINFNSIQYE